MKISKAEVGPTPEGMSDDMPSVSVTYEDGTTEKLFMFCPDEISFSPDEFVGLNKAEALMLRHKKGVDFLRSDPTEPFRRAEVARINSSPVEAEEQWTTDEVQEEFEVIGFLAPYVSVRRKADGQKGTLTSKDMPRIYYAFRPADG